jgi:hypothetical protein
MVVLTDIPLTYIRGNIFRTNLPVLYLTGFAEIWPADFTGAEVYDKKFFEGWHFIKGGKQSITVYQFGNYDQLVRLLTHQPSRTLGLGRNDTPGSSRTNLRSRMPLN